VPLSFDGIVIVKVFPVGVAMTSNTFVVKSAVVYPVTPPPGKVTDLNLK
jgi:hypothetical protein